MATFFGKLQAPTFDLVWLSAPKSEPILLVPGGGGASKTGVKNLIHVATASKRGFSFKDSINTPRLCSTCVAGNLSSGQSVVVAAADRDCILYSLTNSGDTVSAVIKLEFLADPNENGCVNCMCLTPNGDIITAGDDGVIRIWAFSISDDGIWEVFPRIDLTGHSGSVMSLALHPTEPLLCTASKDGTLKLWNLLTNELEVDVSCGSSGPSILECRGCCFTNDGLHVLAIQSSKRGASSLVKWQMIVDLNTVDGTNQNDNEPSSFQGKLKLVPVDALVVCNVPATRLRISPTGVRAAVGASDGSITIVDMTGIKMVKRAVHQIHQLPVTGLSFAPVSVLLRGGFEDLIVSSSADYSIAMIPLGVTPGWMALLAVLLSIAILLVLVCGTLLLYLH